MKNTLKVTAYILLIIILLNIINVPPLNQNSSKQEIIDCFEKNKNIFYCNARELEIFEFVWYIKKTNFTTNVRDDIIDRKIYKNITLSILGKDNFAEVENMIQAARKNKNAYIILKKLGFKIIDKNRSEDLNCIYYSTNTFVNIEKGIVYCKNGLPENPNISVYELEPHWFYYESIIGSNGRAFNGKAKMRQ